jgi:hypothetical protein
MMSSNIPEATKLWGVPPGGVVSMRDTFILNEILTQDKINFGGHFAWFQYFVLITFSTDTGSEL